MYTETRFETSDEGEQIVNGSNNCVHVHIDVVTTPGRYQQGNGLSDVKTLPSNGSCQLFCPPASLRTGILCTHIACVENSAGELPGIRWNVTGIGGLSSNTSGISDDLFV